VCRGKGRRDAHTFIGEEIPRAALPADRALALAAASAAKPADSVEPVAARRQPYTLLRATIQSYRQ
jgi:hypothetical protein